MNGWALVGPATVVIVISWLLYRQRSGAEERRTAKRVARMIAAVQPYCDEEVIAALPCAEAHADSAGSNLLTARQKQLVGGTRPGLCSDSLTETVFLAAGARWMYAFDYAPTFYGYEIKQELARWPRSGTDVVAEKTSLMVYFVITLRCGASYAFEARTMSAALGLPAVAFLDALGARDY